MAAALIAPTQRGRVPVDGEKDAHADLAPGQLLQGVVHDPTARRMDGVAGSAGVFTTAADVARYARMVLAGGTLDGVRILKPSTVKLMATDHLDPRATDRQWLPGKGQVDYATYLRQLSKLPVDAPLMLEHLQTPEEYAEGRDYIRAVGTRIGITFA